MYRMAYRTVLYSRVSVWAVGRTPALSTPAQRDQRVSRQTERHAVRSPVKSKGSAPTLRRWQYTLSDGPRPGVQRGQFRHTRTGHLLRARQTANAGDATVPAWVCETEPQTGAIRVTEEQAALPADTAQSELCPTICLACSEDETTDDEDQTVAGQDAGGGRHPTGYRRLRPCRKS